MAKPTPFQFKTLLVLGRMSNLPTVWSNLMLGWLMGQTEPSFEVLAWLCLGGSLIYTGGMYLNDAFDVRFDRSFRPERPIPSGAISLGWVRFLGWFQLVAGSVILSVGSQVGLGWILALNASVIAYNAFHKRMVFSPVMMAACRFFLLMGCLQCRERSSMERGCLVAELCPWFVYCGFDLCGQAGVHRRGYCLVALSFSLFSYSHGRFHAPIQPLADSLPSRDGLLTLEPVVSPAHFLGK